ncbi:MAG: N-acetylmuramoyl-L-alanine amidase [Cyclobacteriaceae bacterium]
MKVTKLHIPQIIFHDDFPTDQYIPVETKKTQVCLHHTVSGSGAEGDINWWRQTKDRIATAFIIDREGKIHQCFRAAFWGYHIGPLSKIPFGAFGLEPKRLDPEVIGIELDSWGGLIKNDAGDWVSVTGEVVDDVQEYPDGYRTFNGFEKYTAAQLDTLASLLVYLHETYHIPLCYNTDMWDVNKTALSGTSGVFTHTSYRPDKSDCHPQPELIELLENIENYEYA